MENDQLSRYLAALEREDCYRVDAVLKESPHEITQRVFFVGANGAERGPYIRKFIDRRSGMGAAYERIFECQETGRRFRHIPLLHECYHDENNLIVVMEFVHGETLQDVVYRRDPSPQLALEIFPLACDAVSELHEEFDPPLIHRDLKPSNIMVTADSLFIIDFGITRTYRQEADADTVKFGTRAFAPPEQFGFGQTTIQSDVYALGMLLYYCLAEKIPTPQVRDERFEVDDVPPRLRPVLVRATELDASARYASASELKTAFLEASALDNTTCTSPPATAPITSHTEGSNGYSPASSSSEASNETSATGIAPSGTRRNANRQIAHKRNVGVIAIIIAVVFAVVFGTAFVLGVFNGHEPSDKQESSDAVQSDTSTSSANSTNANSMSTSSPSANSKSASHEANSNTAAADAVVADVKSSAPPRNDYNPATNTSVTIAGVTFQIPRCFGQPTITEKGVAYYYAERGTACAMIMTVENSFSNSAYQQSTPEEMKNLLDNYLIGLVSSDTTLFAEATQEIDCTLAGYPARIVTFRGMIKELPITSKMVYFYNPDINVIGSICLGQTDNTQFDYSGDFALTIASAAPVQ